MLRPKTVLFALALLATWGASTSWAQHGAWAQAGLLAQTDGFQRGAGQYLSEWKMLWVFLLFLLWVKTTDWVNYDVQFRRDNYALWNSVAFFPFIVTFILFLMLPWFLVGYLLLILAEAVPLGIYIHKRNQVVAPHEKVLTREHIRHMIAGIVGKFGVKMAAEKESAADAGPKIKFLAQGSPDEKINQANLLAARQAPGFVPAKEVMATALTRKAEALLLEFSPAAVKVRHQLDGAWHDTEPRDRPTGDALLAVLKTLAALNPKERGAKQEGLFGVEREGKTSVCKITTQGVETGERVHIQFLDKKTPFSTFEELGFQPKTIEQVKALLQNDKGILIFATPPQGGLSTTVDVSLLNVDRFLRDFVSIEDVHKRERETQNVPVTTFDSAKGESAATVLPKLIRTYPNVYVVRDMSNPEAFKLLLGEVDEGKLVITTMRAKEGVEALLRVLMLKPPAREFAKAAVGVVSVRLIRKLCAKCKQPTKPPLELLQQLGLTPAKLEHIYRPAVPNPAEPKKICQECRGVGYMGRTALVEVLTLTDPLREALLKTPKLDILRAAARKAGMKSFQEEGMMLVVKGVTSLSELQRVLKG